MTDTTDPSTRTILFERTLEATPEAAFDAWTDEEQIACWWDPSGEPLIACSIDLRPGGAFRFVTKGHAPPFEGRYLVIERPGRLEFDAMGATGTVSFRAEGDVTKMNVSIRSPSEEHFEMFLRLGVNRGTSETLDQLGAFLQQQRGMRTSA
jgi:uncharacterized protein YndB with AHSA1/START domain